MYYYGTAGTFVLKGVPLSADIRREKKKKKNLRIYEIIK